MKTCGIFETKNKLSEICENVALSGEHLIITRHGVPLVCIVPYAQDDSQTSVWDTVQESREKYGPLTDEMALPERTRSKNRADPFGENM